MYGLYQTKCKYVWHSNPPRYSPHNSVRTSPSWQLEDPSIQSGRRLEPSSLLFFTKIDLFVGDLLKQYLDFHLQFQYLTNFKYRIFTKIGSSKIPRILTVVFQLQSKFVYNLVWPFSRFLRIFCKNWKLEKFSKILQKFVYVFRKKSLNWLQKQPKTRFIGLKTLVKLRYSQLSQKTLTQLSV